MVAFLYGLICLIWGSTWLVIKIGMIGVPPFLAAGLRFSLAAAILFVLALWRRRGLKMDRDGWTCAISSGALNFTLAYACVYWAEQYISSGLSAVLYCTMPLAVSLLSRFWTKTETLSARKLAGIAVAMAGTVVLFRPERALSRQETLGMLVALASVLLAAVNLVTVKRHGKRADVFLMNAWGMGMAAPCLLLLSLVFDSYAGLTFTRSNLAAIAYLALFGSVVAFLSYYHLIKIMEATTLSLITLIFPIVAVWLGWLFLKEEVSRAMLGGMAAVLGGVALSLFAPEAPTVASGKTPQVAEKLL